MIRTAAAALYFVATSASAAADALRLLDTVDQPPHQVKLLGNADGYLFDVGSSRAGSRNVSLRVYSGENDISGDVRVFRPIVRLTLLLDDLSPEGQCAAAEMLEPIVSLLVEAPRILARDAEATCPSGAVVRATTGDLILGEKYARLLVVRVSRDGKPAATAAPVWRQIEVGEAELSDPPALTRKTASFVGDNLAGSFLFIRPVDAPSGTLRLILSTDGVPVLALNYQDDRWGIGTSALITLGASIVAVGGLALWTVRSSRPVRVISIGYGADCDITLGTGDTGCVALLHEYRGRRFKLGPAREGHTIRVNGTPLKRKGRVLPEDDITIDGRKIRLAI